MGPASSVGSAGELRTIPLSKRRLQVAELRSAANRYYRHAGGDGHRHRETSTGQVSLHTLARAVVEEPLQGDLLPLGEYYAVLGVDGQVIDVQIDTGSSNLAFAVSRCADCPPSDGIIHLSHWNETSVPCSDQSICLPATCSGLCGGCSYETQACCSFLDPSSCGMTLMYGDGSFVLGALHRGKVSLPAVNITVQRAFFTAILYDSSTFERPKVGGIWGLAYEAAACSPSCPTPLFDSMVKQGLVPRNVFSICLSDKGGALILGGEADSRYRLGPYSWIPIISQNPPIYYEVSIKDFEVGVGGSSLSAYIDSAIFDSGTTLLAMGDTAFTSVISSMKRAVCAGNSSFCHSRFWSEAPACTALSSSALASLPNMTITFKNDVKMVLDPDTYLIKVEVGGELLYCLGVEGIPGLGSTIVLGDVVLRRYTTVFNRENSSIGFAPSVPGCGH
ncbi:hypothetical protein CCYA_CCYA08G2346 [Cyanidiococcus yangmingshanensis]|nr:hypothetical protein CCYA_CCYA08G2346 [Cyanidiococcus yangmingshanensis]